MTMVSLTVWLDEKGYFLVMVLNNSVLFQRNFEDFIHKMFFSFQIFPMKKIKQLLKERKFRNLSCPFENQRTFQINSFPNKISQMKKS